MSRSFRDVLKFSVPTFLCAVLLSGCGSGGSGSADLDEGGSVTSPPPPVTVTETFNFKSVDSYFVVGTPPIHARFSGGTASGNGAWVIPAGETAVIDFGTPADTVKFSTQDNFTATAASSAQKPGAAPGAAQKVDPPFDIGMYVRGTVNDSWAQPPPSSNKMKEVADNVLEVTLPSEPGAYEFKVADADWSPGTNCGRKTVGADTIILGAPLAVACEGGLGDNIKLTIATAGDYKFTFDARDPANLAVTVAEDTGDGGGDGGGEVPLDSTEVRVYAVDTLTAGATPKLINTYTGTGTLNIEDVLDRTGGSPRVTRIEIENLGDEGDIGIKDVEWTADARFAPAPVETDIVYRRPLAGQTTGTQIAIGGTSYACQPSPDSPYSCVVRDVKLVPYANYSMTVTNADGSKETITFNADDGGDIDDGKGDVVFAVSGSTTARNGVPGEDPAGGDFALPQNANEVILFYQRADNDYEDWGVHLWSIDPATGDWTAWTDPHPYEGIDPLYGAYFRIALPGKESPSYSNNPAAVTTFPAVLGFIIHQGDTKDPGPDQVLRIAEQGNMVFVVSGVNDVSSTPPGSGTTLRISGAAAHWVDDNSLLWTPADGVTKVELLYSPNASINAGLQGVTGTYETIALASGTNPQPAFNKELHVLKAWDLPATAVAKAKDLARGQLVAIGRNASNEAISGTLVQIPGALDALYSEKATAKTLGVSYTSGVPSLAVWAPTALKDPGVSVNIYDAAGTKIESLPMTLDDESGVWSIAGTAAWDLKFYTISLQVYSYATNSIVTNEVTDPYSVSLATDSVRSQFVDLNDERFKPPGWDTMTMPAFAAPEDAVLYELHVRDFSIYKSPDVDDLLADADRGKYTAFADPDFLGVQHLKKLAEAGLTHVHVLPAFDIATVKENPADQVNLGDKVEKLCAKNPAAASLCVTDAGKSIRDAMRDAVAANQLDRPAQITEWLRDLDGFNWGYDPLHFGAPEGSYATDPSGTVDPNQHKHRVYEFRAMVKGLNDLGLRTVMDVVYNHTNAAGQSSKSVLDRVVPGYYHRRDSASGNVFNKSCCADTAPEFKMMEKLVTDTGVRWVRDYKVSGFRFDIMSMHPLDSMQRFRDTVQAIDPSVYIYGEGWAGSSYAVDTRFTPSQQSNLGGTGLGSFSDRIRDPVRGGSNYSDSGAADVKNQGFISGNFYAPNSSNSGSTAERDDILADSDNIRVWLAGGLAGYRLTDATGATVSGADVDYFGQDSGYTQDPQEAINYISKHDDETVWDISQYKHATGTLLADRVRADNVGTSLVILGQGVPFVHAGTELLRSKSVDRNSYDSGDWYNEIDWTAATSKWNQGLPRSADNSANYDQIKNVALDVTAVQDQAARQASVANFKELLAIRKSSPLFRLRTKAQIDQRLKFYNTGPFQIPGVIAMGIEGCTEPGLTPPEGALMVIFNASDDPRTLNLFGTESWTLHPVQQNSADPVVKTATHDVNGFYVPARTTAVFRRTSQTSCAPYSRDMFVRGIGTDWTDSVQNRFNFLGGTLYEVTKPLAAGVDPDGFKIADSGWSSDTDCGATSPVVFGEPLTLACQSPGNGNIGLTVGVAGDYVFRLDAASTANPVLTVAKKPAFAAAMYVRGVGTDWSDSAANLMQPAPDSNTYRAVINVATAGADADGGFKIASSDWTTADCGSTNPLTIGAPLTLVCNAAGNGNIAVTWPQTGTYLFALDATNPAAPVLTVEKTPYNADLYVRGVGTDWSDSATNKMTYLGGGLYRVRRSATVGPDPDGGFKIASSDWTTADCGSGTALTIGTPLTLVCNAAGNGNIAVDWPATGTYTFSLSATSPSAPQLTVTGP